MRLNARLDDDAATQVNYLTTATGHSVSHVVREAIAVYHAQVRGQRGVPSRVLALAGTGDSGRSDLATGYKALLADAVADKHQARGEPAEPASPAKPARRRSR